MPPRNLTYLLRRLAGAALLGLGVSLASPLAGEAHGFLSSASRDGRASGGVPAPITLRVSAGYQNVYRDTTWTPVRVTLHNGTSADVRGTLEVPQSNQSASVGVTQLFHGLYEAPVVLPAGTTKEITLYVPGSGVQDQISVRFHQGARTLAGGSIFPTGIDSSALLLGFMAGNTGDATWLVQAIHQQVTTRVVRLSPSTLDPVPQALAALDIIVLTNVDTSQLDSAQLSALREYVRNGGSLLVVGGPAWQETLRPLPASLLPGRLAGSRTLPDLHGLYPLGSIVRPSGPQASVVSLLAHASGTILASQSGFPLVVRKVVGRGNIEYLAFDPALNPVQSWRNASGLLQHLVGAAAPLAISRTWSPQGFRSRFRSVFSSATLSQELSNLPPATLPLLAVFAVLTLLYILILGPVNFLVLRWIQRPSLAWVTIPVLALSYFGSVFAVSTHFRGSAVQLNSLGMITLDSSSGPHPATFYVGMAAPLPGDYHLTYKSVALPAPILQTDHFSGFFWRNASTLHSTPLGMRLQEGPQTNVTYLSMARWKVRDLLLDTAVHIPGTIQTNLGINAQGDIAGTIHNTTNLNLLDPVMVAGQTIVRLPTINAGSVIYARARPGIDSASVDQQSFWAQLYGGPNLGDGDGGFGGCCDQIFLPPESALIDRVRNATAILSQQQTLSKFGEVMLIGWSEQPLGTYTVDGQAPQRRDLNLIIMPLSIHFPSHGPFRLREGTLSAHLVDIVPQAPQSNCCGFFSGGDAPISVGAGGSITFEFDTSGRVRFRNLDVSVNSGTDGSNTGTVYDWHAQRWVPVDLSTGTASLSEPNRFVSPAGQIMLKLQATPSSGDLTIDNPSQDVQISGTGAVT